MVFVTEHTPGTVNSFYGPITEALQTAMNYGKVCSLPEFFRVRRSISFDDILWRIPFTLQTEEIIGKTKAGNPVDIIVHGPGLLTPKRISEGIEKGLTRNSDFGKEGYAVKLADDEIYALLEEKVSYGKIAVYPYSEFLNNKTLPENYAIARDLVLEQELPSGEYDWKKLAENPRLIALAGSQEELWNNLELISLAYNTPILGYHHLLQEIDLSQPQGRLMEAHGCHYPVYDQMQMDGTARFLAVKSDVVKLIENSNV